MAQLTIGDKIQILRKAKGLTQKDLGQMLGVSASMIGQYETNVRKPKLETLKKFADVLNISLVNDLLDLHEVHHAKD
ncbi:putative Xre family DNA-binding protein [Oscillibacter valericigenes Sjm18-20]|nr:putative Xre family DNA-binding protein [Oscillibacter valericigenes Sjm18-20]